MIGRVCFLPLLSRDVPFSDDTIAHSVMFRTFEDALLQERGSRCSNENDAFRLSLTLVDDGNKKLDHLSTQTTKKTNQQIARSAPVSGRAAAPCAARSAQAASISAQVQRLSLGSVKSARAIKAASASARNVSSRAAAVAAVAEEKKPFTKVRSVFIPS